MGIGNILLS